ncbi:MAG TPA: lipoprotein-releasing system ATP-binding protein LolD, partial [Alistipes sp.]|nr:lipoprotein-releasing system ATP-binding protein LolD [Alistipes sp.]
LENLKGKDRPSKEEMNRRVTETAKLVQIEELMDRKPRELSGGQQQRVAIARALVNAPAVLLADEPSGNLDTQNREEIHRLFFELREKLGQTIVIVTHDDRLAGMADRRITMSDGLIR